LGAALLFFLGSTSTIAQTVPPAAGAPTREQIEQQTARPATPPPAQLTVEGDIERAPCALARPEFANIRFTPTAVTFNQLKGMSPADLTSAYQPFLGKEQPIAVVCEIRDRAATILREAGYIASVEVPEQRIADGHIRFDVLMARLVWIRVRGDAGRAERHIAAYLEPLTRQDVFNKYVAERHLLLASDLPGYSVRLALRSADRGRGEVIGDVTVLRTPAMVDFNVQNYGSHEIGRWGALLRGQVYGLAGSGDRATLAFYSTADFEEQQTVQLGYDTRIGSDGLTIGGQFTYSWTKPDLGNDALDIRSRTMFATLQADYPFIRTQAQTVRGTIGLDVVDQDVELGDLDVTRDRLRVAFARVTAEVIDTNFQNRLYNGAEPRWRLGGALEVRQGLEVLGADDDCLDDLPACFANTPPSRLDGDPSATVLRAAVQGEFRPMPRLTLAGAARGQFTDSSLLSFEEFSVGNYSVGRGYDPGSLLGDRGVGFTGEVRFGSTLPRTAKSFAIEPYAFVDHAVVWHQDTIGGPFPREDLTSVGGGFRAAFGDQFRIDVAYAKPLDRIGPDGERPDPRLLVSFTSRIWPWSLR
jgi:hemolysin activation/secretion protein